jgi:hypothetical protein
MDQRAKNLCVYVGKQNKGAMKTVVKHHFCCFPTMLDKVIQVEARKQLGMNFGSGGNAICRGLTLEEIQKLDFSKMDFAEFIEDFKLKFAGRYKAPKPGELGGIAGSSQAKLRKYDGNPNNQINNMTGWHGDAKDDSWEAEEEARIERERLAELERQRLAKLEAERLERERLAKLEAERIEKARLAKLEAERLERERLAGLEAQRQAQLRAQQAAAEAAQQKIRIRENLIRNRDNAYRSLANATKDYQKYMGYIADITNNPYNPTSITGRHGGDPSHIPGYAKQAAEYKKLMDTYTNTIANYNRVLDQY